MGQKKACLGHRGAARSRQGESKEVGGVGSKRTSSGDSGGHHAWWGGQIFRLLRLSAARPALERLAKRKLREALFCAERPRRRGLGSRLTTRARAGISRFSFADRTWCHFTDQRQTSSVSKRQQHRAKLHNQPRAWQPRNSTDMQLQLLLQAMPEEENSKARKETTTHGCSSKPTHPPGDRNVPRVGLEFSYSTGRCCLPLGGGGEVTLHWKGPERGPTCCLRSNGINRSRKSQ
jgi:hypothetical protein